MINKLKITNTSYKHLRKFNYKYNKRLKKVFYTKWFYKKAKKSRLFSKKMFAKVYINFSTNNIFITVIDSKNQVFLSVSPVLLGLKNKLRKTYYAAEQLGYYVGKQMRKKGIKKLKIIFNGYSGRRRKCVQSFVKIGLSVLSLQDKTMLPHNGCRLKKPKRL